MVPKKTLNPSCALVHVVYFVDVDMYHCSVVKRCAPRELFRGCFPAVLAKEPQPRRRHVLEHPRVGRSQPVIVGK